MSFPVTISYRHCETSPALNERIEERAQKLEHYWDRITRCTVLVEVPTNHHRKGDYFEVKATLAIPGDDLVANKHGNSDPHLAVRDAFDSLDRQLRDYAEKKRSRRHS